MAELLVLTVVVGAEQAQRHLQALAVLELHSALLLVEQLLVLLVEAAVVVVTLAVLDLVDLAEVALVVLLAVVQMVLQTLAVVAVVAGHLVVMAVAELLM
jgi:hypothetical protein